MELAIWSEICYNIHDEQETTKQGFYGNELNVLSYKRKEIK